MIKYKVIIKQPEITLGLMGREKTFTNNQEVTEDAYTKFYPQYFVAIGEMTGFTSFLATPVFVPNGIEDFMAKEAKRKEKKPQKVIKKNILKEQDELKEVTEDFLSNIKDAVDTPDEVESIEELIEDLQEIVEDFDVKIETE
jgi:hypothetical protein